MSPDNPLPHRRSIRLKGYDYTSPGAYFITICVRHGVCVLGDVESARVRLSVSGEAAEAAWARLPTQFQGVRTGPYVIMPNHVHGIVTLTGSTARGCDAGATDGGPSGGEASADPASGGPLAKHILDHSRTCPLLGEVVRVLKAIATQAIRREGIKDFAWLRNYYEHIIRNDDSYQRIWRYIRENPLSWQDDLHNLDVSGGRLTAVCRSLVGRYGFPNEEADRMLAYARECRRKD
jgi:putative transposase